MQESVFFYSKFCPYSKKCYDIMTEKGLDANFKYISVDKDPRTKQRDPLVMKCGIKSVPSVFISGRIMSGKELFSFISNWGNKPQKARPAQGSSEQSKEVEGFETFSGFASVHSDNLINPPKDSGDTVQKIGSLKINGRLMDEAEEMAMNQKTQEKKNDLDKKFQALMEERSAKDMIV